MKKKKSLYEEMKKFQAEKKSYIIILLVLGVLGLIFPVIPGLFLIGLAIALLSPRHGELILKKIKNMFDTIAANFRF